MITQLIVFVIMMHLMAESDGRNKGYLIQEGFSGFYLDACPADAGQLPEYFRHEGPLVYVSPGSFKSDCQRWIPKCHIRNVESKYVLTVDGDVSNLPDRNESLVLKKLMKYNKSMNRQIFELNANRFEIPGQFLAVGFGDAIVTKGSTLKTHVINSNLRQQFNIMSLPYYDCSPHPKP